MTKIIDLRSDTVTRPTAGMREAIANSEVGDDVIGQDPTVARLQETVARLLGKEDAVFMPSGTMTNQVAVRLHCKPGEEFICDAGCHIYNYEQGGFAQLSGLVAKTIAGEAGVMHVDQLDGLIRPENDHFLRTSMLCIENTHNRGGGKVQPPDKLNPVCQWARDNGLALHLDGARLFNAAVALGVSAAELTDPFDTVSVCFSKGLGAPVGSALAGSAALMNEARRHRKLFGGGMRQAGVIAAGALYAVENHIDRLAEDHANAHVLANAIRNTSGLSLVYDKPETNILFFDVDPQLGDAPRFVKSLAEHGVNMLPESNRRIRALTHLDVDRADIEKAGTIIGEVADSFLTTVAK